MREILKIKAQNEKTSVKPQVVPGLKADVKR